MPLPTNMQSPTAPPPQNMDGLPDSLATPQDMAEDLESTFNDLQAKDQKQRDDETIGEEQMRQMQLQFLTTAFDALKDAGVDPEDPQSVADFLQQLEAKDPDLAELFINAFNLLTPDGYQGPSMGGDTPPTVLPPMSGPIPGGLPEQPQMPGMGEMQMPDMGGESMPGADSQMTGMTPLPEEPPSA